MVPWQAALEGVHPVQFRDFRGGVSYSFRVAATLLGSLGFGGSPRCCDEKKNSWKENGCPHPASEVDSMQTASWRLAKAEEHLVAAQVRTWILFAIKQLLTSIQIPLIGRIDQLPNQPQQMQMRS